MNKIQISKFTVGPLLSISLLFICVLSAFSQQSPPAQTKQLDTEEARQADVSITANVTAQELKFETVPNPVVEFPGTKERKTVWEADRRNLPKPVEPGVTYRNIGIQLRIASRFADIDRIVAEALGEVPVTEEEPKSTETNQNLPPPATDRSEPKRIAGTAGKNNLPRRKKQ